jgi:ParB/RepB/Spo0J family partition protein
MKVIPFAELTIPADRQRQHFDPKALVELADSIMSKGLLHPPVVRWNGETFDLIAGERRTRAIRSISSIGVAVICNAQVIPPDHFPVTLIGDLDALSLREAELEENILREDLTWQERAAATAELADLRQAQAAEKGETTSIRSVASEIMGKLAVGSEITRVAESINVAKHLEDPDVAKAKSQKEAVKIIRKKAEAAHREVLAQQFNPAKTPHSIIQGSCFDFAKAVPDNSQDCILTDPPYGIGADNFGDMAGTEHAYVDSYEYAMKCYDLVATEGFRVAKEKAHLYVFLDPRYWDEIRLKFILAGWDVWPTPLIWDKTNGMLPKPDFGPRRTYEMILYANKGERKVLKVGMDVLRFPLLSERDHGAQKPVGLFADLLSRSCYPGNSVIDFFSGSGTILPASNRLKLIATAMERVPAYYHTGLSRADSLEEDEGLLALLPKEPQ